MFSFFLLSLVIVIGMYICCFIAAFVFIIITVVVYIVQGVKREREKERERERECVCVECIKTVNKRLVTNRTLGSTKPPQSSPTCSYVVRIPVAFYITYVYII